MTAPDPAARAALLRRLPRDGFVPPDDAAPWSRAARAAAFAAEVEAFAAAFWALAPDARRERFNALRERRYGPAAARLAELESGLDVEGTTPRGREETALTGIARELFVLRPRERARRRAAWLAGLGLERDTWEAAARAMAFADPVGARLDPPLFTRLAVHLLPLPRGVAARAAPVRSQRAEEERDARNARLIFRHGF